MRTVKITHIGLLLLCVFSTGFAQEGFISTSRNMQFINPSYHGINMVSKAGFITVNLTTETGHRTLTTNTYGTLLLKI